MARFDRLRMTRSIWRHTRKLAIRALHFSGAVAPVRWFNRKRLLVVTYHAVVRLGSPVPRQVRFLYRNSVTAKQFKRHMNYLKQNYTLLEPADLAELRNGKKRPERAAVVTFDDALLNNYTVAAPILSEVGIPAVFFAPTGFVDAASAGHTRLLWTDEVPMRIIGSGLSVETTRARVSSVVPTESTRSLHELESLDELMGLLIRELKGMPRRRREHCLKGLRTVFPTLLDPAELPADPAGNFLGATMSWAQLRELASAGMGIGSHTVNHVILARVSEREAEEEIQSSTCRIVEHIQPKYKLFAYPNGRPDDFRIADTAVLESNGYAAAFTQIAELNPLANDPLTLRRINISGDCPLAAFAFRTSGLDSALKSISY